MTDWAAVRRDFPVLGKYHYLDASAAAPTPVAVGEAVARFYADLAQHGDLPWNGWLAEREAIRERIARFIGATADEIAFTANTSAGINLIVDVLAEDGPVVASSREFPTVTLPWLHRGVPVRFVEPRDGAVVADDFTRAAAPEAATIAVSHVQFANGYRVDLPSFAAIKDGRSLVVSASQSAGALPIDVRAFGIDALAVGGHKWMCAGYGTGFAYISKEILARRPPRAIGWMSGANPFGFDPRHIDLLPTNQRSELGCPAFPSIFALGAAADYLAGIGIEAIAARILALNEALTTALQKQRLRGAVARRRASLGGHARARCRLRAGGAPPAQPARARVAEARRRAHRDALLQRRIRHRRVRRGARFVASNGGATGVS